MISAFVIPLGFEPKACCLEGSCSIQLSYGTSLFEKPPAKVVTKLRLSKSRKEIFYFLPSESNLGQRPNRAEKQKKDSFFCFPEVQPT